MWTMRHVQFVLFTTKLTKDTKGSDILNSELRALVSFVVNIFFLTWLRLRRASPSWLKHLTTNPEEPNF
jgi:hypothetical protein